MACESACASPNVSFPVRSVTIRFGPSVRETNLFRHAAVEIRGISDSAITATAMRTMHEILSVHVAHQPADRAE